MKSEVFKSKRSKRFLIIAVIICTVAFAYPFFNKYYLKPKKWKSDTFNELKKKFKKIDDEKLWQLSECWHDYFKGVYYDESDFPLEENYTLNDKHSMFTCMINCIVADSLKTFYMSHMDSIIFVTDKKHQEKRNKQNGIQ